MVSVCRLRFSVQATQQHESHWTLRWSPLSPRSPLLSRGFSPYIGYTHVRVFSYVYSVSLGRVTLHLGDSGDGGDGRRTRRSPPTDQSEFLDAATRCGCWPVGTWVGIRATIS